MDFQEFKTAVIARCTEVGVTEYELYYQAAESVSCDAFRHEISEFKSSSEGGVCLRCVWGGRMGYASTQALTEEAELGYLLSYAGFLDMAIVTGTALSHGVARYAHLARGETSDAEERAFARTLADSILKDFCYKNVVREDLLAYIRKDLGGDPNNFWVPEIDREAVLKRLESGMEKSARKVLKNLEN